MKKLKDYKPQEFGANKDDINSLIMEQASENAEARMMAAYGQPIEYFVEPDVEEGESIDKDTSTRYKAEFISLYNTLYDEEYDCISIEIGFDLCTEDGIRKSES